MEKKVEQIVKEVKALKEMYYELEERINETQEQVDELDCLVRLGQEKRKKSSYDMKLEEGFAMLEDDE